MKKLLTITFLILISIGGGILPSKAYTTSDIKVFESDNHKYFGLKTPEGEEITKPEYRKLIRLGENSWIVQKKNYKFGLMDCEGNFLVQPKYSHAERLFDKWVKLGNNKDYGVYDEFGEIIVPPKFKSIEPLFGSRFLTYSYYKYGVYNSKGEEVLPNIYDFIYMPDPKTMRIKYDNMWYEIEQVKKDDDLIIPDSTIKEVNGETFMIKKLFKATGFGASYGVVTATDYTLKIFSSISEAYEETIDELMFSKGLDSIPIIMKASWLPKFPIVYAKKYYENIIEPNNSPLSEIRNDLLEQIK